LGPFERLKVGLFNAREVGSFVVWSHGRFAAPEIQVKSLHDRSLIKEVQFFNSDCRRMFAAGRKKQFIISENSGIEELSWRRYVL
jgi:hypothetical protein